MKSKPGYFQAAIESVQLFFALVLCSVCEEEKTHPLYGVCNPACMRNHSIHRSSKKSALLETGHNKARLCHFKYAVVIEFNVSIEVTVLAHTSNYTYGQPNFNLLCCNRSTCDHITSKCFYYNKFYKKLRLFWLPNLR